MARKIALEVKMKIRTTAQRQLNHQLVSSYVQTARVFQRQVSVIISRTVTTVWMKLTVLVLTPHNGVVRGVRNASLLAISAMGQRNVHKEKTKRTALRYYQQHLLQPYLVFQAHHNQSHISPPSRLSPLPHSVLKETNPTK